MPYNFSTKKVKGQIKHCMTSKDSGKTYCYNSESTMKKGMRLHEAFKHGFKMTRK